MSDIALKTAKRLRVVESREQATLVAGVVITAGQMVRIHPTTGRWALALGTTLANAKAYGMALENVIAGQGLTALRKGVVDGFNLVGNYGTDVFLSDTSGAIADAAGTVSLKVGDVIPVEGQLKGSSPDKLLRLDVGEPVEPAGP